MLWSKAFIPTLKEIPQDAESVSHQLMLRAGLIRMLLSGVYSYLPLGFKVLQRIENIVRQEMNQSQAAELLLPALQPRELWVRSGRDEVMGEVMVRFVDRRGRNICLGPTHEEVITDLVAKHVSSYRQLPVILYQIQTKFRDEIRPRFGVIRACEFIMKDAYSFDSDKAGLDKNYEIMHQAYLRIFKRLGLNILSVEADSGVMGGKESHEFMVPAACGEDMVLRCSSCGGFRPHKDGAQEQTCAVCYAQLESIPAIEIGHIFKLGTKYSETLQAQFLDASGQLKPVVMGCYGIGVSRLIAAVIEQNHDDLGIIWPTEVSPYQVHIIPLDVTNPDIMSKAQQLYAQLSNEQIETLMDDRDERAGVKFKDADLLGLRVQVIIGKDALKNNTIEIKSRATGTKLVVPQTESLAAIKEQLCV